MLLTMLFSFVLLIYDLDSMFYGEVVILLNLTILGLFWYVVLIPVCMFVAIALELRHVRAYLYEAFENR